MSRDLTEEMRLNEELLAAQFYTRSLIESTVDALMTTDPLGIVTDGNQQMESLTGCVRDELIGTPFKQYFTDPPRAEAGIVLVPREGKVANYELTATSKEGHGTVVSYNATTFYGRDGKPQGVFAAARDVTERKRAEKAPRKSEARFRILLEGAPLAMVVVDASGRIVLVNGDAETLFGRSRGTMVGERVETLLPERYRGRHVGHRAEFAARPRGRRRSPDLTSDADRSSIMSSWPARP